MKRFTLLAFALATVVAAFATTPRAYQALNASRETKMKEAKLEIAKPASFKSVEAVKDADDPTLWVRSFVPDAFHYGSSSSGVFYYVPAWYVTPYMESLKLYNVEGLKSTWILNDADSTVLATEASSYALPLEEGIGYYYGLAPLMRTPSIPGAGTDKDTIVPDYQYGKGGIASWAEAAGASIADLEPYKGVINADPYFNPMTLCNIYTEDTTCYYFPFDYGTFGAAAGGDYWYGTKCTNGYISTEEETKYFDTIAVLVSNPGVMYIDNIQVGLWTRADKGTDMFPGENDHVRLTIYPLDDNFDPDWENPIVSTTAGINELVNGSSWADLLKFNFLEEDPFVAGNIDTVPAIIEGDFAIVFDEFNDGTAAFGFLSDGFSDYNNVSQTYFYFYYPKAGRIVGTTRYMTPANLLVNIIGFMPTVVDAPKVVEFKEGEELTQTITLMTNTWAEDYDIESDEWISVEAETVYDTREQHTFAVELTITVKASDEVRLGQIDILATGYEFSIPVSQNGAVLAVDNVTLKNDGKTYNVLGVEVGEDYKGVVIRNGEKFVR